MNKKRMTGPPKKKHVVRPRTEIVRLTPVEQGAKAAQEFDKARRKLGDAQLLAERGDTPEPCVHTAYYAMYHAACAVLLVSGGVTKRGDVPDNHRDVLLAFGRLVAQLPAPLDKTGVLLNEALRLRMVADHVLGGEVSAQDAETTVRNATQFLQHCEEHWTF